MSPKKLEVSSNDDNDDMEEDDVEIDNEYENDGFVVGDSD